MRAKWDLTVPSVPSVTVGAWDKNGSVHELYRLKALLILKQVNTSAVESEQNLNEQTSKLRLTGLNFNCMQMSLVMTMRFIFCDD